MRNFVEWEDSVVGNLEVRDLRKRFGEVQALDGLSLTVNSGEIYGFVGSNGAGKTTAMRIMLGVTSSDGGTVTYDGKPVTLATRGRIGYMPEERGLYPKMKVGPQLIYLAELHGLTHSAATAAMETWTERLGIDSRRGDDVMKLSLGNQQRVQLAAALVHSPDILVLDEPFSGLDPVAVDVMSEVLIERAREGVPVIFSSHQLDLVERLCHRVGIVKAGRMVSEGTIDELRSTGRRQFTVRVDGAAPTWADAIPNVDMLRTEGPAVVVEMAEDDLAAEKALLAAATAAGTLREFTPVRPHLVDLFRHVVTTEEAA